MPRCRMVPNFLPILLMLLATGASARAETDARAELQKPAAEKHVGWDMRPLGLVPVLAGGRLKPLDSYARELVLAVTGSRTYQGWDPVDLLVSWIAAPRIWPDRAFIRINRKDLKRQVGLDEERTLFTPRELYSNASLAQYATRLGAPEKAQTDIGAQDGRTKQNPREAELRQVVEHLGIFNRTVSGEGWPLLPRREHAPWGTLADGMGGGADARTAGADKKIQAIFVELLKAYQRSDSEAFAQQSELLRSEVQGAALAVGSWPTSGTGDLLAEVRFNRARPFFWSWILYLLAGLAWFVPLRLARQKAGSRKGWGRAAEGLALALSAAGTALHVGGMVLRSYLAGRPPVTNMYESVIWVSFGVMLFAWILWALSKRPPVVLFAASWVATLCMLSADASPTVLDPSIRPLVPVLRSNLWLTIHVLTITLGYAAFALTLGLANGALVQFLRISLGRLKGAAKTELELRIRALNQLTYRAMQFGVVLLAAGTILGGVWADYSWGRFWGWDPKEVWALIALLTYLAVLHGRYTSWVGPFGFSVLSVACFSAVLMAWYGVNFVLGVGLHSYGFSSGGLGAVAGFLAVQTAFVLAVVATRAAAGRKA